MATKISLTIYMNEAQAVALAELLRAASPDPSDIVQYEFVELFASELEEAANAQQDKWHGFISADATSGRFNGVKTADELR